MLDQEKLLGLSARLSIMEVPEDVEKAWAVSHGHGARVVANALHNQLQVCRWSLRYGRGGFKGVVEVNGYILVAINGR